MPETQFTSYDRVPYKSYPFSQTHPERLATIAALFGVSTKTPEEARVLEIGCAGGGNLIPMAEQLPGSRFLGIDLSRRQIEEGQETISQLGLKNVELLHKNILDVTPELGQFDYILCHGVYSWVPDAVQEKILSICSENLAPQGVAYVSYNTYPGWRMRGMVRDMMCFRARRFENPEDGVRQARGLLDFLSESVPTENNAYGILLKNELNMLKDKEDYYLYHEHLEEVNDPVYFYQFVERSAGHGLKYLGEADFGVMSPDNFPQQVKTMLQTVATNRVEMEQYMDFVRNRLFRQTLLVHDHMKVDHTLDPERVVQLYVSSPAKPEQEPVDIHSKERVVFRARESVMNTSDGMMKSAMLQLQDVWPQSVRFTTLLATAQSQFYQAPSIVDTGTLPADSARLAEPLIRCFATTQVNLSVSPARFTMQVDERPLASALARFQAKTSSTVTNLKHETVRVSDLQRHVLQLLDGSRDKSDLLDAVCRLGEEGRIVVHVDASVITEPDPLRNILALALDRTLSELARLALLRCPDTPQSDPAS